MIIKDFNSFKTENPNETVFSIKQLMNKGVSIDISKIKDYYSVNQFTKVCYDLTTKPIKIFTVGDDKYKIYNLQIKGQWFNSWFGVIILKNEEPVYVVHLYERKNINFDSERLILTITGREEIVTIYFDNGELRRTKI
jgi:hypothetical protein